MSGGRPGRGDGGGASGDGGGAGEGESGGGDGGGGPAGGSGGGGDGDGGGGGGRGGGFEGGEGGGGNGGGGRCGGGKGSHSRVHLWWSRWQSLTSPVHIRHSMHASKSAWVGMRLIGAKFAMGGGDRGEGKVDWPESRAESPAAGTTTSFPTAFITMACHLITAAVTALWKPFYCSSGLVAVDGFSCGHFPISVFIMPLCASSHSTESMLKLLPPNALGPVHCRSSSSSR